MTFAFTEVAPHHTTLDPTCALATDIGNCITWYSPRFSPKDVPRFYDIASLTENPRVFKNTIDALIKRYEGMSNDSRPTHILGFDARGFLLGTPLALGLGIPFVMLRKKEKSPGLLVKSTPYSKEYHEETEDTMVIRLGSITPGSRVVLVDDLIATGGTALSGFELVHAVGGTVVDFCAIIAIPFLQGIAKIREYRDGLFKSVPIFTLIDDSIVGEGSCADPKSWPPEKPRVCTTDEASALLNRTIA